MAGHDLPTQADDGSLPSFDPIPSRAIIWLHYQRTGFTLEQPDEVSLQAALRQLENDAAHIADVVEDTLKGRLVPNAWNLQHIAGPVGAPLAHAISTRSETVGLGEDRKGQLIVAAAMSGVIALLAPRNTPTSGRLAFLGHDVADVRHAWIKSLGFDSPIVELFQADDDIDPYLDVSLIVPTVRMAKGRFWDTVHFDVRTNFALAVREFEKAGIEVVPTEDIVTHHCREASSFVRGALASATGEVTFQELQSEYTLPSATDIVLLPSSSLPAPLLADWPIRLGRFDPDPLELIMVPILSESFAVSVPCGVSADGLPTGILLVGPASRAAHILALANWYLRTTRWPTLAGVGERSL